MLDEYTLQLKEWQTPATDYPEGECQGFRIHRSRYTRGYYHYYGLDDFLFLRVVKPIPITNLQELRGKKWHNWMLDDPPHWRAMQMYAEQSEGNVLVAGLGLGLICHALKDNPKVTGITVIERSLQVIELIDLHLPLDPRRIILVDDFYDFIETDHNHWDTIIVDLWVARGMDEKMKLYHREVFPLFIQLQNQYPKAKLVFHGFQTVSDIKLVTKPEILEMLHKISE